MPANTFYTLEKKAPIAWVRLNRPAKKNAMNPPAWREAPPLFEALDQDPEIRVVILAANGPCFSVGIDLVEMTGELPEILEKNQMGGIKWRLLKKIAALQETMTCIERCRKPVIAAIHGYCIGAGLDMVTACDIRLCSRGRRLLPQGSGRGFRGGRGRIAAPAPDRGTGHHPGAGLYRQNHRCPARP